MQAGLVEECVNINRRRGGSFDNIRKFSKQNKKYGWLTLLAS